MNGPRPFAPEDAVFERLRGKLTVSGDYDQTRSAVWRDMMGNINPEQFYSTLSRGLPGKTSIMMESRMGGDGTLDITSTYGGKTLLTAERYFSRRQGVLNLKEVAVHKDERGHGIGTILLSNQIDMMTLTGLRTAEMRTGRDDGPFYWAMKGARLKDEQYATMFLRSVNEQYQRLKDRIDPATCVEIEKIIAEKRPYCNRALALLPGELDGKPLGAVLLHGCEGVCVIDSQNPDQMQLVQQGLRNVPQQRDDMLKRYPALPEPAAKTGDARVNAFGFRIS